MDNPLQQLLTTTYTKDKLHHKIMLLKEFFADYFFKEHGTMPVKDVLRQFLSAKNIPSSVSESLLSLDDNFFHSVSQDNFRELLDGLEDMAGKAPLITLYVPTILPPPELQKLGEWFRSNVAPKMLMDIKIDAGVVGGCSFVWNGVHHDFSLKHYLNENRSEIKTLFRNYDRVS